MGSLLQIRDVPDDVRRALKARAAEKGESLNRYLLGLLQRETARPTVREVLDRAARREGAAGESALAAVRAERDERDAALGEAVRAR